MCSTTPILLLCQCFKFCTIIFYLHNHNSYEARYLTMDVCWYELPFDSIILGKSIYMLLLEVIRRKKRVFQIFGNGLSHCRFQTLHRHHRTMDSSASDVLNLSLNCHTSATWCHFKLMHNQQLNRSLRNYFRSNEHHMWGNRQIF